MDEPPFEGESISDRSVTVRLSDTVDKVHEVNDFPSHVCYCPGWPAMPKSKKPGDINLKDCPPERYQMDDSERSGHPHCIAPWAKCAINERYSAWYVGGGTAWLFPGHARQRREDEGTWGFGLQRFVAPQASVAKLVLQSTSIGRNLRHGLRL